MSEQTLQVGDVVRVKDPDCYLANFARKVRDRNGVVEWVGPDAHGQFKGMCWVKFGKRNGRGKEFRERIYIKELIVQAGEGKQP